MFLNYSSLTKTEIVFWTASHMAARFRQHTARCARMIRTHFSLALKVVAVSLQQRVDLWTCVVCGVIVELWRGSRENTYAGIAGRFRRVGTLSPRQTLKRLIHKSKYKKKLRRKPTRMRVRNLCIHARLLCDISSSACSMHILRIHTYPYTFKASAYDVHTRGVGLVPQIIMIYKQEPDK